MSKIINKPIKLIYILGSAHSGSTLTDLILGSHSCIESGGEIKTFQHFFDHHSQQLKEKRICTCGVHVNECQYWSQVRQELELNCGNSNLDLESDNQEEFIQNNYLLMKTILNLSGKKVFCDSSKNYTRLKKFLKSSLFDVTVVHIVRDGRAVAFSRQRKTANKNKIDQQNHLQRSYYQRLTVWLRSNSRLHLKLNKLNNYICLRYEDLVKNPPEYTAKILSKVNLEFEPQQLEFWQFKHHNLSGNRMRKQDNNQIQFDRGYLDNLSFSQWWLGTMLGFSALKLFGYPLTRAAEKIN